MQHSSHSSHCHPQKGKKDKILWGSLGIIIIASINYSIHWFSGPYQSAFGMKLLSFSTTIVELLIKMSWGLIFAILFVGLMDFVPRQKFHQIFGTGKGVKSLFKATLAGVLLDLCSHGILLVGMKLYERGLGLGKVMAFLIASPWNSFSMTLILWSLIGFRLTLAFILISCVIAVVTGLIFEALVEKGVLPGNPNSSDFENESDKSVPWFQFPSGGPKKIITAMIKGSLHESQMILKWIFFGLVLTALVKELLNPEQFQTYFGPDVVGVLLTLFFATIIEVCSEGTAPLASELVTTAGAPGNAFTFLMAGVATDYTEILAIKETTKSLKVALFLPLVTVPQIFIIGILMNGVGGWN